MCNWVSSECEIIGFCIYLLKSNQSSATIIVRDLRETHSAACKKIIYEFLLHTLARNLGSETKRMGLP